MAVRQNISRRNTSFNKKAIVGSLLGAGLLFYASTVSADVRVNSLSKNGFVDAQIKRDPSLRKGKDQKLVARADVDVYPYQVPSNFGYAKLQAREKNNNDRFLRDNIDNEANQRNTAREAATDMLPCRQSEGRPKQAMKLQAGQTFDIPLQFNNPHDGDAEINIWRNIGSQNATVATVARFKSGGGYSQNRPSVTLPNDLPACTPEDKCVMQYYWQTVEPRSYAICTDLEIAPAAAPKKREDGAEEKTETKTVFKEPIYYADSFDTAHIDSTHSGYRGQDPNGLSDSVKARLELQKYTGNGGLLKDAEPRQALAARANARNQVKQAVKNAEKQAAAQNKAAQKNLVKQQAAANKLKKRADNNGKGGNRGGNNAAPLPVYEGDTYSVVLNPNAKRQFTNTYVTNVDYAQIQNNLVPKFEKNGIAAQTPAQKASIETPEVYGMKNRQSNLKNKNNAANLQGNFTNALGSTSKKLLKLRADGGDEEALDNEHKKLYHQLRADLGQEGGSEPEKPTEDDLEVRNLVGSAIDLPDMSEGASVSSLMGGSAAAADDPDSQDIAPNPDDEIANEGEDTPDE